VINAKVLLYLNTTPESKYGRKASHSLHLAIGGSGQLHVPDAVPSLKEFASCTYYTRGRMNCKAVLDVALERDIIAL
jgi:hypothetical protein